MSAVEHALLAIDTARRGDHDTARAHLADAQRTRATARRHRQIIEIAALVVAGRTARAAGLALEHTSQFPDDVQLLALLTPR